MRTCIIFGSSRSDGNTSILVSQLIALTGATLFDLNEYKVGYYRYPHDQEDDFLSLFEEIIKFDHLIFCTPVYWYSMSAIMKTFFDRISEPLRTHPNLTNALKNKSLLLFNMSSSSHEYPYFHKPFEDSANYLKMVYKGHVHCWLENKQLPISVLEQIKLLLKRANITKQTP